MQASQDYNSHLATFVNVDANFWNSSGNDSSSLNQSTSPGVGLGLQNAQPTDAKQLSIAFSPQFLGTMDSTNPTPIGDMLDMPLNLDWVRVRPNEPSSCCVVLQNLRR